MSTTALQERRSAPRTGASRRGRLVAIVVSLALLGGLVVVSLLVGSGGISPEQVWRAFLAPDGSPTQVTVTVARVDRTVLAILVGLALGVSGALIQALTRNPLADPGILGVNAGAGFAVALSVAALGVTEIGQYIPFAFIGALLASVVVFAIAGGGRGAPTPVRLTLVGLAFGAVLIGITRTLALIDETTFNRMRFWDAGTVADRPGGTISAILPFLVAGLILAAVVARPLNVLALGEDMAKAVGARIGLTRVLVVASVTLLCGAATAAAGPIAFVGLMIPHAVRWITGPDWRWILVFSAALAPVLMLVADILGRVIAPVEIPVGVVTAFVGAPVLIFLVRRARTRAL